MPSAGLDFSRLHQLLQSLKDVQDKLTRGPRQIQARRKKVVAASSELADKEGELKSLKTEADKKNLDLKSKEAQLVDLKRKLNGAKTNREYEIITGQIDADIAAKAVLEDEVLEYLDRADTLEKEIATDQEELAQLELNVDQFAKDFEASVESLKQEEEQLLLEVKDAQKIVPSEMREQFERLVEAYGPEAMASCNEGVCSHCFVQMTPQSKVLLNSGKVIFCGNCGRLNYVS